MDWYIDTSDYAQVSDLRREFASYLSRHAAPDQDVPSAELAFSELLTNAAQHATGPAWVSVDWTESLPSVSVYDMGADFSIDPKRLPSASGGRGLAIATSLAMDLKIKARQHGGTRVDATFQVERAEPMQHDPPRRPLASLPSADEAGPEGFDRESFLRALVVQLAQAVESKEGPGAAEELIAQVGIDVGSNMEQEYRRAIDGETVTLDAEQLTECFVRLKHAIDGDFYPVEITPDRIVLANRRCPFGDAVQRAPALCRMTSSVFGGIAANNAGAATVLLEERIAVGDHQCKVVVHIGPASASQLGNRYQAPA